jgi:cytidylate kinase
MNKQINIAIDGPVASGKGTVAGGLAKRLGIPTLNTGAIYRGVTVALKQMGVNLTDKRAVFMVLPQINIQVFVAAAGTKIHLDNSDISNEIFDNDISVSVPTVSAYPFVREFVNAKIKELAGQGSFIMEGRDIGTAVLPEADYKFFLTAAVEERARRRMAELAGKGKTVSMDDMIAQVMQRDETDANRETAPLRMADDAILIDATEMTIEQTIDKMAEYIKIK